MKVYLLARKLSYKSSSGVERYCARLHEHLSKYINVQSSLEDLRFIALDSFNYSSSAAIFYDLIATPAIIMKMRDISVYHAMLPEQALCFPALRKRNTVVTFHDFEDLKGLPRRDLIGAASKLYATFYTKIATKFTGHIIANSSQTKEELTRDLNVPEGKVTVVPLGVDDRFRPESRDDDDSFTIGYVGALKERKRVRLLIEAFLLLQKRYPELGKRARLVICGTGPQRKYITSLISKLGLNNIEVKGFIPESNLVKIYNNFDVFVFPSRYEGFGLPILEAQRSGVPVLIMEDARIPVEVIDSTIRCKDLRDLVDKIYLLLTDELLRRKVSYEGLEHAKKFSWKDCAKQTLKVYQMVSRS